MTYVLDASAFIRFLTNEPGALEVERIIKLAKDGTAEILMSAVNWGEVLHSVLKKNGEAAMHSLESNLLSLPIQILAEDSFTAKEVALFQFKYKVPYADSFAGSLAARNKAILITADYDFHSFGGPLKVHFLPTKAKGRTP
jgi:predicted nucleic acid-binding protein